MIYIKERDNPMQNSVPEKVRILLDCLLPARQGTKSVLPTAPILYILAIASEIISRSSTSGRSL